VIGAEYVVDVFVEDLEFKCKLKIFMVLVIDLPIS
jgi:hypothetical protein